MSDKKDTKERVEEMSTINFSITKCPLKVYREFTEFCKQETADNYSFGLKTLLEGMQTNMKEEIMYEEMCKIKARLDNLENKEPEEPKKKSLKTFGSSHSLKTTKDKEDEEDE